jgi:hypothetical protein
LKKIVKNINNNVYGTLDYPNSGTLDDPNSGTLDERNDSIGSTLFHLQVGGVAVYNH